MQTLDPSVFDVPSEYEKVSATLDSPISGSTSSYVLDSKTPTTTFTVKDSNGKEHWIKSTLINTHSGSEIPSDSTNVDFSPGVDENKVTWKEILTKTNLQY